jgi:methanogenic corrinoid protein MtbC1
MKKIYQKLSDYIQSEDRNNAVLYTLELLKNNDIDVVTLYQHVLAQSLNSIDCDLSPDECIWKEHVKTAIVRACVEVSFPYVIEEIKKATPQHKKVLVLCPSEEYHEIGAKMVYDFFLMAGFEAVFVGANTPTDTIKNAVTFTQPDYIAISVTDYYNIFKARQVVDAVKSIKEDLKIIIGGPAFFDPNHRSQITHDHYLMSFEDIKGITS